MLAAGLVGVGAAGASTTEPTARVAAGGTWTGMITSAGTLPVPNNPCHDAFTTKIVLTVTPGAAGAARRSGSTTRRTASPLPGSRS